MSFSPEKKGWTDNRLVELFHGELEALYIESYMFLLEGFHKDRKNYLIRKLYNLWVTKDLDYRFRDKLNVISIMLEELEVIVCLSSNDMNPIV